ncbi:MAG: hypothetical protein IJG86_05075 [Clostridia bacterium]|nr:hypothetical protein [Clostridia bacterium]
MFKCNQDLESLIDVMSEVNEAAQNLGRLIGRDTETEILAKDGFWELTMIYGTNMDRHQYVKGFDSLEELRDEVWALTIGVKMARLEEV